MITNPILTGFNPDPSIVRVGDDYYIATSTFEWFPGVQIHHSRDLVNWRLLTRPLDRLSQLDMRGIPNSGGIWAPCLTFYEGTFYLVYTIVHELNSVTKDSPNYLVTAENIMGPWSEPTYLNASGFDPSLFHDDDGRKWLVNMVWDHRPEKNPFYGIELRQYDPQTRALVGDTRIIFKGTELGRTEAPHIYKKDGFYYLLTAEGGTEYEHAVTVARSKVLGGPYTVYPLNPMLTSWGDSSVRLQKAGHADLVETQNGEWYLVHLCGRPLPGSTRCVLGRETAIQRLDWIDGWPVLSHRTNRPENIIVAPDLPSAAWTAPPNRDDFDEDILPIHYQIPRSPLNDHVLSLTERRGYLRLRGGDSMESHYNQVIVARRRQAFAVTVTTKMEFQPRSFQQMAGLVCYYSTNLFHYLCMSVDERAGNCLYVQSADDGIVSYPLGTAFVTLGAATEVFLRADMDNERLTFLYALDGANWVRVCDDLDGSMLSDDYGNDWGFTGTFIGMACQDLSGRRLHADFDFFEYHEAESG